MTYDWYNLINNQDFIDLDIPSKTLTVNLEGIGEVEVLIVRGTYTGVLYDDVFLPVNMIEGKNPFEFDGYAVYQDSNRDIWLGFPVEEA